MYKRLTISLVLMVLAGFSLTAAYAYLSDSISADVSITAGTADLKFTFDADCDGDIDAGPDADEITETLEWDGILPGDATADCTTIVNDGDSTLDVYLDHQAVTGSLVSHIDFHYAKTNSDYVDQDKLCEATVGPANSAAFWSANEGKGCSLGTLDPGEELHYKGTAIFAETDEPQNGANGGSMNLRIVVKGYTN